MSDDADAFTPEERRQLRQLLMRVGNDVHQQRIEMLAKNAPDIISMVDGKKATSAIIKFTERLAKYIVSAAAAVAAVKMWFWGGRSS